METNQTTPKGLHWAVLVIVIIASILSNYCTYLYQASRLKKATPYLSRPTQVELYRLENNLIVYYPSDAILLLQRSLAAEGYDVDTTGIFDGDTLNAVTAFERNKE